MRSERTIVARKDCIDGRVQQEQIDLMSKGTVLVPLHMVSQSIPEDGVHNIEQQVSGACRNWHGNGHAAESAQPMP